MTPPPNDELALGCAGVAFFILFALFVGIVALAVVKAPIRPDPSGHGGHWSVPCWTDQC